MKKLYVLTLAAVLVAGTVSAQRAYTAKSKSMIPGGVTNSGARTNNDTLTYGQLFDATWSPTIYGAAGGGYILGNNGYGDLAKAQAFMVGDLHPGSAHYVTGAGFWFVKEYTSGNPNSVVTVRMYSLNGTGTATSGTVNIAPNTSMASVTIPMSTLDTVNFQYVTFPSPVLVTANQEYAIGIDLTTMVTGDTVGIVSSADQEFQQAEVVWERWAPLNPAAWYTLPGAGWGGGALDFAAYILATITFKGADVPEMQQTGMVLGQNIPNPAAELTYIDYAIENSSNISLDVYDVIGNKVMSVNEGNRPAGAYRINIDTKDLTSGTYFYTLTSDMGSSTRKMTISK